MGIFGAMLTAVSGLRAQAYSLENISGNIANSQTTGFKRVDTSFVDFIPERANRQDVAGLTAAFARPTNTLQGDLQPTGVATHIALNGQGYFSVQERTGYAGTQPTFDGVELYTRRGDFATDKDGRLVNGAGYYLKGASINPATGAVSGTNGVIQISSDPVPAKSTETITYGAILPSRPRTTAATANRPNSELVIIPENLPDEPGLNPFAPANPITDGTVRADQQTTFINRTIDGGRITIYNDIGNPIDVQTRWAKTSNETGSETWQLFYLSDTRAEDDEPAWTRLGEGAEADIVFDRNGRMTSPADNNLNFAADATIDGVEVGGVVVDFGANGLTQTNLQGGVIQGLGLQQDGYTAGVLDSVAVGNDGRVFGQYTNGQVVAIAQIAVVQFNADDALKRRDGGVFEQTADSGPPLGAANGSSVVGGALEGSNTDISEEFSKMIVTQQAYSANTRVVSTSQQMMQDAINMVR